MERIILHIDVNNAFLSWNAVDRLNHGEKIDIRERYAVIGGDEDSRRGIVLAKSNLCKKRGVVTGESLYIARKKCPYLEVYSGNHKIYKYFSDKMYEYLLQFTTGNTAPTLDVPDGIKWINSVVPIIKANRTYHF